MGGVLGCLADQPREWDERGRREDEQRNVADVENEIGDKDDWRERERGPEDLSRHAASVPGVLRAVLFDWGDTLMDFRYDEELMDAAFRAGLAALERDRPGAGGRDSRPLPGELRAPLLGPRHDRGDRVPGSHPAGAPSLRDRDLGRGARPLPRGRACRLGAGPGARLDDPRAARGAALARPAARARLERVRPGLAAPPRSRADGNCRAHRPRGLLLRGRHAQAALRDLRARRSRRSTLRPTRRSSSATASTRTSAARPRSG